MLVGRHSISVKASRSDDPLVSQAMLGLLKCRIEDSGVLAALRKESRWHSAQMGSRLTSVYLDKTSFVFPFSISLICNLLKTWSGRRGSNPRRPAWELTCHLILKELDG